MSASVENDQSEQIKHDSSTAKKINKLFSSSKTRHDGWKLLNSFLPHCPDEFLLQFCVSWMQNCCKIDGSVKNKEYAVTLLGDLFKISKKYQELKKSVSFFITTQYFDFFFKYFRDSQPGWDCTKNCLLFYRGACGAFQDGLQKHLTEEISKNRKIPLNIAECFALLPCTGGGGNDGVNYKRNWKSQFMKILSICHSILNDLYDDAEEFKLQEYETLEHTYQQPEKVRTMDYLVTQLYNHITVLNCMLLNQYPAPKTIPPDLIFHLICRGLALSPKSLKARRTTKLISLQKALPHVHCVFLSLLKAAVVTCKNLLYPYSRLVCKIIKQVLEWTNADSCYIGYKSVVELRVSAYESLCNWLAVARSGSCVEGISVAVVSSALSDIVTKKAVVSLKAKPQSDGRENTTRRVDVTPDSTLCYAALKCLQFLLKFSGVMLKPKEHKFLQEKVVELLLEIQKTPAGSVAPPFGEPRCRKELYSLLLELVHQPCTKWPPPTHFALELFSRGVNDSSPEISSFCSAALNFTTIIIHPQYDNGGFPTLEASDGRDFTEPEIIWREKPLEDGGAGGNVLEVNAFETNGDAGSVMSDPEEKLSNASEELVYSNSEDSRTTIMYSEEVEGEENLSEGVKEVAGEEDEGREKVEDIMEVVEESEKAEQTEQTEEMKELEEVMEVEEVHEVQAVQEAHEVQAVKEAQVQEIQEVKEAEVQEIQGVKEAQVQEIQEVKETKETEKREEAKKSQNDEEPSPKKRKILEEQSDVDSLVREEEFETPANVQESKGKSDRSEDSETRHEALTPAENHPKKRYFLRSKTKGPAEEGEEGVKSGSSPDSGKSTPLKGLTQSSQAACTPSRKKKKVISKITTNSEAANDHDDDIDEEKLKAAFDDSLAD